MTTSPAPNSGHSSPNFPPFESFTPLRHQWSAATQAVHEALAQMSGLMETQIRELQSLREQLTRSEQNLLAATSQVTAVLPEQHPLPRPTTLPMPQSSSPLTFHSVPAHQQLSRPSGSQHPVPVAKCLPSGPMMTQILWPSKPTTNTEQMASTPTLSPNKPRSVLESMLNTAQPEHTTSLEKATLEELNAALAYAFSQVSSGTSLMPPCSVTSMMPAPMPTSALRFGQMPELADAHGQPAR